MDVLFQSKSSKKGKLLAQLRKAGYTTKKGRFGAVKIGSKTRKKSKTRKRQRKRKMKRKR